MDFEMLNSFFATVFVKGEEWGRVYRSTSRKDTDRWQLSKWKKGAIVTLPEFNSTCAHEFLEKIANRKNDLAFHVKVPIINAMSNLDDRF